MVYRSEKQLDELVHARRDTSDMLINYDCPSDVLGAHIKTFTDEHDTVYLIDENREELSFLVHGFVCDASFPTDLKAKLKS